MSHSPLQQSLKAALAFDEDAIIASGDTYANEYDLVEFKLYGKLMLKTGFLGGARLENARLAPIHKLLIEAVGVLESREILNSGHTDVKIKNMLTRLHSALEEKGGS